MWAKAESKSQVYMENIFADVTSFKRVIFSGEKLVLYQYFLGEKKY